MWQNATEKNCTVLNYESYGWVCENEVLQPVWYEGDPTPLNVEDILQEKDDDNFNNDQDEDEVFDNNLDSDDEMSE